MEYTKYLNALNKMIELAETVKDYELSCALKNCKDIVNTRLSLKIDNETIPRYKTILSALINSKIEKTIGITKNYSY